MLINLLVFAGSPPTYGWMSRGQDMSNIQYLRNPPSGFPIIFERRNSDPIFFNLWHKWTKIVIVGIKIKGGENECFFNY